jgi:hypothetical protein
VKQHVRLCKATDGIRLAYAVHGSDSPLIRVSTWLTHIELDWESPVWRHTCSACTPLRLPRGTTASVTCRSEASDRFDRELADFADTANGFHA